VQKLTAAVVSSRMITNFYEEERNMAVMIFNWYSVLQCSPLSKMTIRQQHC